MRHDTYANIQVGHDVLGKDYSKSQEGKFGKVCYAIEKKGSEKSYNQKCLQLKQPQGMKYQLKKYI